MNKGFDPMKLIRFILFLSLNFPGKSFAHYNHIDQFNLLQFSKRNSWRPPEPIILYGYIEDAQWITYPDGKIYCGFVLSDVTIGEISPNNFNVRFVSSPYDTYKFSLVRKNIYQVDKPFILSNLTGEDSRTEVHFIEIDFNQSMFDNTIYRFKDKLGVEIYWYSLEIYSAHGRTQCRGDAKVP